MIIMYHVNQILIIATQNYTIASLLHRSPFSNSQATVRVTKGHGNKVITFSLYSASTIPKYLVGHLESNYVSL